MFSLSHLNESVYLQTPLWTPSRVSVGDREPASLIALGSGNTSRLTKKSESSTMQRSSEESQASMNQEIAAMRKSTPSSRENLGASSLCQEPLIQGQK
jgi:hypothetical protein